MTKPLDILHAPGAAIEYINSRLPESKRWKLGRSAYGRLNYHRRHGNIRAAEIEGSGYLYPESELDRFLATRAQQGRPSSSVDLSQVVGQLGVVSDLSLSKETGIPVQVIRRERVKRGIEAVRRGPKKRGE